MVRIAKLAEVEDITTVTDLHDFKDATFPVRAMVLDRIRDVASRCQPGDWFVWFFAGHGVNVPDVSGEEEDGLDEAFVTPDVRGKLTEAAVLIDDDFAEALDTCIPLGVRILCICDCCHSGTICDIDTYRYRHEIYQISASLDNQEAEDTGKGGVLTYALKKSLVQLGFSNGGSEFSLHEVFMKCKRKVARITSEQEVSIQYSGAPPDTVAWPMCFPVWKWAKKVPHDVQEFEYEND